MTSETFWEAATWEGARREQLKRALKLSVRERLKAMEALAETGARLSHSARQARAGAEGSRSSTKSR